MRLPGPTPGADSFAKCVKTTRFARNTAAPRATSRGGNISPAELACDWPAYSVAVRDPQCVLPMTGGAPAVPPGQPHRQDTAMSGNGPDPLEIEDEKQWKNLSLAQKAKYMVRNISVEPIGALYVTPSVLAGLATQNLNLEKACYVNLRYGEEVCRALTARETAEFKEQETAVQKLVAGMISWKTIVHSALPSFMMMFLGSWSDRHGKRKPFMLMPIIGDILMTIGLLFCTYFFYELPMEVAGVVESLFPAITGGWFTMFMAVYSYIGDVTTVKMRTVRIGFVSVVLHIAVPAGMALSGVLYRKIGYYGMFSTSLTMYIILLIYTMRRIQEPKKSHGPEYEKMLQKRREQTCGFVRDLVNPEHVVDTVKTVFKKGERNRRKRVVMLMVCCMVIIGPLHGEMAVMYLFTRYRFNWNEVDFSLFSTYSMITNLFGTMVSVGVFSHMLKIDDALIGVMSCMSKILSCFVYAFATTDWMIYLAPIVEILNGTSFIAMRSIISKLVPADELGKVNSLFGVCEALMPLVYGPMYSAVYTSTIHTLPGAFFLLGGALTLPAVIMFLWMYTVHKKENKRLGEEARAAEAAASLKGAESAAVVASVAAASAVANGRVEPGAFVPSSLAVDPDLKKSDGVVNGAFDAGAAAGDAEQPPPEFATVVANGSINKAYVENAEDKV